MAVAGGAACAWLVGSGKSGMASRARSLCQGAGVGSADAMARAFVGSGKSGMASSASLPCHSGSRGLAGACVRCCAGSGKAGMASRERSPCHAVGGAMSGDGAVLWPSMRAISARGAASIARAGQSMRSRIQAVGARRRGGVCGETAGTVLARTPAAADAAARPFLRRPSLRRRPLFFFTLPYPRPVLTPRARSGIIHRVRADTSRACRKSVVTARRHSA